MSKRFTDAELAAECQASVLAVYRRKVHGEGTPESIAQTQRTIEAMATLHRFAMLPHYDEASL